VLKFFAGLPPCLIGMEACATAHYWARELTNLASATRNRLRSQNVMAITAIGTAPT
jgi:transposase